MLLAITSICHAQKIKEDSVFIIANYEKIEKMIPMRDGVGLYTAIYIPKDSTEKHPILLTRTPYNCEPYGQKFTRIWYLYHMKYCHEKYIMVYQDVRGRYMSEGEFEDVRPFNPNKKGTETDEASDAYDTIDWLVNNLPGNSGNVGVFGISYPGFYSTMAALSGHPALKAVSPQAPVTDWFIGDDFHHKGALMLMDAFDFFKGFGVPRPKSTATYNKGYEIKEADKYQFYLKAGPLSNFNKKYLGDSIRFWNDLMNHPVYDNFWQSRNPGQFVSKIMPAILIVGGLFDAEDLFGSWNLYKAIESKNPSEHFNKIVMGPWFHGTWEGRGDGSKLGKILFGSKTSTYYQDSIEFPFFQYFLKGIGKPSPQDKATVFFSGENEWKKLAQWPPAGITPTSLYFQPKGKLSFNPSVITTNSALAFTSYTSDPRHPVRHEGPDTIKTRTREYMTGDQRFAHKRKDVITFTTGKLEKAITVAGPVIADLLVSTNTTDADFVVKVIDVFPTDISKNASGPDTLYKH